MDLARMNALIQKVQKLQPAQPPKDERFVEYSDYKKAKVLEIPENNHEKLLKARFAVQDAKRKKGKVGQFPEADPQTLNAQKQNYLLKKQRELEIEQLRKEIAAQRRNEKLTIDNQTQNDLQKNKAKVAQTVFIQEKRIKRISDEEYLKKKETQEQSKIRKYIPTNSIESSYVSIPGMDQSIIKKKIEDYHTLPRDEYNRKYKTMNAKV